MITISIKGVLIGILLIATIVLVVFLIVLVTKATDTIKKINGIIDNGTDAAGTAKAKIDQVNASIKETAGKVSGVSKTGFSIAQKLVSKVFK